MNYISPKEAAQKWNVSERMVSKYCMQGRIDDAYQELGIWYIPDNATKPVRKKKEAPQPPKLLQTLIKERDSKYYCGLYEYLQINMTYSSSRMASNRLTRNQIEALYEKDRIFTTSEDIKFNDIVEARNHFLCVDFILTNAMKPLTSSLIHQLQSLLLSDNCRHKRKAPVVLGYRKSSASPKYGMTTPSKEIPSAINKLFNEYETQKDIGFYRKEEQRKFYSDLPAPSNDIVDTACYEYDKLKFGENVAEMKRKRGDYQTYKGLLPDQLQWLEQQKAPSQNQSFKLPDGVIESNRDCYLYHLERYGKNVVESMVKQGMYQHYIPFEEEKRQWENKKGK